MRKILAGLCLLWSMQVFASGFNQMIFFGDSLSDNGNLYKALFKIIPKSPPYYQGRFSNGPVWSEKLAQAESMPYRIYAVGGATAIFHLPRIEFISPMLLEYEVGDYLSHSIGQDKSQTLYSFWIGANDYLYGQEKNLETFTDQVVNKEIGMMTSLANEGAKYFLVLNLPDLSRVPQGKGNSDLQQRYHALIVMNNKKLAMALSQFKSDHPDVSIYFIDIFSFLNDVLDHPDKYNQLYHINITNLADACWGGGYTLQQNTLEDAVRQDLAKNAPHANLNAQLIAKYIASTDLQEAYRVGKAYEAGLQPCAHPEQYLFWDEVHPTMVTHDVLSQIATQTLQAPPMY